MNLVGLLFSVRYVEFKIVNTFDIYYSDKINVIFRVHNQ